MQPRNSCACVCVCVCACVCVCVSCTQDVKVSQEQANAAVKAAFAQGINYFDTSPFYGLTRSETGSIDPRSHLAWGWVG